MGEVDDDIQQIALRRKWDEDWRDYFYCLDYSKEYIVTPKSDWMSISLVPCQNVHEYGFEVHEECIADRE